MLAIICLLLLNLITLVLLALVVVNTNKDTQENLPNPQKCPSPTACPSTSTEEAIIVSGGKNEKNDLNSVEVIRGDGATCLLPSLPLPRVEHSQSGLLACGGFNQNVMTTCTRLANGVWTTSHNL